jgi:hypothetical protein
MNWAPPSPLKEKRRHEQTKTERKQEHVMNRKPTSTDNPTFSGNRRTFLKSAGLLAVGAPAAMAVPFPSISSPPLLCRAQFVAEGVIPIIPVAPPIPWVLPPLVGVPLPEGFEVRLRTTFPVRDRNILAVQLIAWPVGVPLPEPLPPILPEPNPTMAYYEVRVAWVEIGCRPKPTISLTGRVVLHNPQFPGFGDQTGATAVVCAGFSQGPAGVTFNMLTANVAGSHITVAPQAVGKLLM